MLPMALGVLAAIVVFASLVVGFTAAVNATQTRFHQQVITLPDILPKDSLKMYDKHGTSIYQAIDQGPLVTFWSTGHAQDDELGEHRDRVCRRCRRGRSESGTDSGSAPAGEGCVAAR